MTKEQLRAKINQEKTGISWLDLQRFFAAGQVVHIAMELDLVDVAVALSEDEAGKLTKWQNLALVNPVSDNQARKWFDNQAEVWAVVVAPWVLVQSKV